MKLSYTLFAVLATTAYFLACTHEPELDFQLEQTLNQYSQTGSYEWYIMPASDDYAALPNQDPKNPVTEAKVRLGKMLFFEPGLALENKFPVSKISYSCSSCHIPSQSFTAGRFQGIADGAVGFGDHGEGRTNGARRGSRAGGRSPAPCASGR